ncbi:hypothetical protein Trydic_g1787 [Trypoxylus dichotomus]
MEREIKSIEKNNTWTEVEKPENVEVLNTKWETGSFSHSSEERADFIRSQRLDSKDSFSHSSEERADFIGAQRSDNRVSFSHSQRGTSVSHWTITSRQQRSVQLQSATNERDSLDHNVQIARVRSATLRHRAGLVNTALC